MNGTISLASLVDSLLQKAYHDLTVLQELLPRKSDADRKLEIVQYARCTRALVIRLLALVKWAGSSSSVQKCSEMSMLLNQQSQLYISTADQLVNLARNVLVRACTPNFSLAPALDVLSTGTYPRLPMCIKERIVPPPTLTDEEKTTAYSLIDEAIRKRLVSETLPSSMSVKSISKGVITFVVPYEFEVKLSIVSDDLNTPWRLISLKILVGEGLPGSPVLLHDFQMYYLHQLVQSRLYAEESPLVDCYQCLHTFCLSLQLDCLHTQALRLSSEVYGGYVKVEEYGHGHHMKVVYWRPGSDQLLSAFLLDNSETPWPKLIISVDPLQSDRPFLISHTPPLPEGAKVNLSASELSLELLLKQCVLKRSHALLRGLKAVLNGTGWHKHAALRYEPLGLCVHVPLKYGTRDVVFCVDTRVGHITAAIEPPCQVGRVSLFVEEMERSLTSNKSTLSMNLSKLQCHLFLANVAESVTELGYKVEWSLPLVHPLPFHIIAVVFIELQPLTYLIVGINEGLVDQYHLIKLLPVSSQPSFQQQLPATTPDEAPPKSFLAIQNLIELDPDEICFEHLKSIILNEKGPLLKRKLRESKLELPSLKRLCVRETHLFTPLPSLVKARMTLLNMQTSLHGSNIPHCVQYTAQGTPTINIFEFPQLMDESHDIHELLSAHLQSCQLIHSGNAYTCTFIFKSMLDCSASREIILHQVIPETPSISSQYGDLGQSLLAQWMARLALLGLTLELQHYLEKSSSPLRHQCTITSFTYDKVSVMFGNHTLTIEGKPGSLFLSFSDGCPHSLLREHLENFLNISRSLPLLLQGLCATEKTMEVLSGFIKSLPNQQAITLSTISPPQVQLKYNNFLLTMNLQADSTVLISDLSHNLPGVTTMTVPLSNTLNYLQDFLHSTIFGTPPTDTDEAPPIQPAPGPPMTKPTLFPAPSPIASPRLGGQMWPGSPSTYTLPSIPPFSVPSPRHGTTGTRMGRGGWECELSLDQFKQLLTPPTTPPTNWDGLLGDCSPLEIFLGSLTLLYHVAQNVSKIQAGQQAQAAVHINFVQCDRGVYTYRTENLTITLGIEGPLLNLSLKPQRENVWTQSEMDILLKFFKKEVMCRPFTPNGISAFIQLLMVPLTQLKGCVQLLQHQVNPTSNASWRFSICLTVPPGTDLTGTPFSSGSAAVIYGRGKLLLFLKMEQTQGSAKFVLPVMHDPRSNVTYVARFQNQYRAPIHQPIDTILRKSSQETNSAALSGHPSASSLFPAINALSHSTLPV